MTQFSNNLKFIGRALFPKLRSKKLNDFNKSQLAEFLEMDLSALSRWISGDNPISRINLVRIANKVSEYYKITIPPEVLLKHNLRTVIENHPPKSYAFPEFERHVIADKRSVIDEINFLLNKHQELQPIIYELLLKYDKK